MKIYNALINLMDRLTTREPASRLRRSAQLRAPSGRARALQNLLMLMGIMYNPFSMKRDEDSLVSRNARALRAVRLRESLDALMPK